MCIELEVKERENCVLRTGKCGKRTEIQEEAVDRVTKLMSAWDCEVCQFEIDYCKKKYTVQRSNFAKCSNPFKSFQNSIFRVV